MYFSSIVLKRVVLAHTLAVVAIQLLLIRSVSSLNMTNSYLQHKCYVDQGKYKPGSVYEENLKKLIHIFDSTGNFRGGYDLMSLTERPDLSPSFSNVAAIPTDPSAALATPPLSLRKCPKYKGGIIWYDQCFLEISSVNTEGKIDYDNSLCMSNPKNVTSDRIDQEKSFSTAWMSLIDNLTGIATSDKRLYDKKAPLYASGERNIGTKKIYGMMQCTKDLSNKACRVCMGFMIVHFHDCYDDKQGGRVFGRSCSYRFELYPFVSTKAGPKYLKA